MAGRQIHILFLCVANSCRSQMAQAIGRKMASKKPYLSFDSAGSHPGSAIDSGAREYLIANGFAIEGQRPKSLSEVMSLDSYDAVVALCEEACVAIPGAKNLSVHQWNLKDPSGVVGEQRQKAYQNTHEIIQTRLSQLIEQLEEGSCASFSTTGSSV